MSTSYLQKNAHTVHTWSFWRSFFPWSLLHDCTCFELIRPSFLAISGCWSGNALILNNSWLNILVAGSRIVSLWSIRDFGVAGCWKIGICPWSLKTTAGNRSWECNCHWGSWQRAWENPLLDILSNTLWPFWYWYFPGRPQKIKDHVFQNILPTPKRSPPSWTGYFRFSIFVHLFDHIKILIPWKAASQSLSTRLPHQGLVVAWDL